MKNKGRQKVNSKPVVEIQPVSAIEITQPIIEYYEEVAKDDIGSNAINGESVVSSFSAESPILRIKFLSDFTGSVNGKSKNAKKGEVIEPNSSDYEYYSEYAKIEVLDNA